MIDKKITLNDLKKKAPKGEFLAYINKEEAAALKRAGGSGHLVNGIPSFIGSDYSGDKDSKGNVGTNTGGYQGGMRGSGGYQGGNNKSNNNNNNDEPRGGGALGLDKKGPEAYEIIGGKKFNVNPFTRDQRNRAKAKQQILNAPLKDLSKKSFFNTKLGKALKFVGLGIVAPQLLAGTKLGTLYSGYNKAKTVAEYANKFGITDKNVATSLTNSLTDKFAGFNTIGTKGSKGSKDPPRDGGDGDGQNALMSEYLLLLKKMEQGVLQKEEQGRFNSLKSRLGKAQGGIMNFNMNRGKLGGMNG